MRELQGSVDERTKESPSGPHCAVCTIESGVLQIPASTFVLTVHREGP